MLTLKRDHFHDRVLRPPGVEHRTHEILIEVLSGEVQLVLVEHASSAPLLVR